MKLKSVLLCSPLILLLLGALGGCELFGADPPVLQAIMDDSPEKWLGSYYGMSFAEPTPDIPDAIHRGLDHTAQVGTAVKACASGRIVDITEYSEPFLHTVVQLELNCRYTAVYIFETAQSIEVTERQEVEAGDILGYLANFYLLDPTLGVMDFGLMENDERVCPIPYVTAEYQTLLETWFDRCWTRSATNPGPCTCHYTYP